MLGLQDDESAPVMLWLALFISDVLGKIHDTSPASPSLRDQELTWNNPSSRRFPCDHAAQTWLSAEVAASCHAHVHDAFSCRGESAKCTAGQSIHHVWTTLGVDRADPRMLCRYVWPLFMYSRSRMLTKPVQVLCIFSFMNILSFLNDYGQDLPNSPEGFYGQGLSMQEKSMIN